jgi:GH25 family lysozyme M1 (1,4-beta-N-acetylmuramidase)
MTGSNGIDLSNNNRRPALTKGFSGLDFVIAKATEGTHFTDPDYFYFRDQAAAVGALFGAYHFGHPELAGGAAEAEAFMRAAAPQSGRSLWYDYEAPADGTWRTSPDHDAENIELFRDTIKGEYPRAKVGIYSNLDGFARILPHLMRESPRPFDALWLAEPNGQLETPDAPLAKWGTSWNIHQYETFAGIDRNYSRWTKQQMHDYWS